MELGKYYTQNQKRIETLSDDDWKVALKKCKEHIKWKIRQRTLSGAHSASNLGMDAVDYYLGIAFEKILAGEWEWKYDFTLGQQMIRIVESYISKNVEKVKTAKYEERQIKYVEDVEQEFYDLAAPPDEKTDEEFSNKLMKIEDAIEGDIELEMMLDAIKEGHKRADIAQLMDLKVRQVDKLREKLIRRVKQHVSKKV